MAYVSRASSMESGPLPWRLKSYLDNLVDYFERPAFIDSDPIAACHWFDDPRDQEVIGLYAALLAWGRRATVLRKIEELCERMNQRPCAFVWNFDWGASAARLEGFKHRTFSSDDAIWFTSNLHLLLKKHKTVEAIFAADHRQNAPDPSRAIQGFSQRVMNASVETPTRLQKHLARPLHGSAAKRLCMYLRWMVRRGPVDLGLWQAIEPRQLVLPLDVHSGRQARSLGMLARRSNDWKAVRQLTRACRMLCPEDPARYDYAFFGLGINGEPPPHPAPIDSAASQAT